MSTRTKVINFRISEEEYVRLQEGCSLAGINSVSQFTRAAIHQLIGSLANARATGAAESASVLSVRKVATLGEQLNYLSRDVDQMAGNP